MIKRYFTLDEACAYLSEHGKLNINPMDLFDHVVNGRLRVCCWYYGNMVQTIGPANVRIEQTLFVQSFRIKGYIEPTWLFATTLKSMFLDKRTDYELTIDEANIIEAIELDLPERHEHERFHTWDFWTPKQEAEHFGKPLIDLIRANSPDDGLFEHFPKYTRSDLLIPFSDLQSLLQGKPRQTQDAAPQSPARNWPLIAGALLSLLITPRRNQTTIKSELEELGIRGLGNRTLDDAFAEANREFKERAKSK